MNKTKKKKTQRKYVFWPTDSEVSICGGLSPL